MGKFCGKVGYVETVETSPGVHTEQVTERMYFGDVNRLSGRFQTTDQVNDDITIANEISIVADPFAYANFNSLRYVEYMGTLWKITNVEVKYPRLILTVGGVYNGS